jgi:hypothetical protein
MISKNPMKFVSTSGKVFFGKESKKASEKKLVEKPSGEKPSEKPHPKPKPKLMRFNCCYCGRDSHKDEFCFKRKREGRMAKEWANKVLCADAERMTRVLCSAAFSGL